MNQKLYKLVSIILSAALLGLISYEVIGFIIETAGGSYILLIPAILLFLYLFILPLFLVSLHLVGLYKLPEQPMSRNPLLQNKRWGRGYYDGKHPDEEVKNQ